MRKAMAIALLLTVVGSTTAFGASARWNCLGKDHRFMLDTSNYGIYPGRMLMFSNALWIIPNIPSAANVPDNMMSGLLVSGEDAAWAVHYNLPGPVGIGALRRGLAGASGSLAGLADDIRPIPDLFYARKMGDMTVAGRFVLGLAGSEPVPDETASAMSIDLAGGVIMPTGMGELDLGARLHTASFSDDAADIESTGGIGVNVDARLMMDRGYGAFLIPVAGISYATDPTVDGATEVSRMGVDFGLGYNKRDLKKNMLVYAVTMQYTTETRSPASGDETSINTMEFAYLTGYEKPLNSWLIARGGARGTVTNVSGDSSLQNGTTSGFYYNFGVRTVYKRLLLDFQFDRALLHRGPYALSGSGDDWAGNVCLTYLLESQAN